MFQLVLFGYFYLLLALNRIQDPGSVQYALNLLAQHQYNAHHAWLGSTLNVQHLKHQKNERNTTPGLDHAATSTASSVKLMNYSTIWSIRKS